MKKILIVDGNSILNRAFYGVRGLSTSSGMPTNAVYGLLNILKRHIDNLVPDYMICAWDMKAPTFRHEMYDGYKSNRKGMPDELAVQLPYAKRAAAALGFECVEKSGFEADDIIGTYSRIAAENNVSAYILTGDRDSLQLLSSKVSVILVKTKEDILYTPEKFSEDYGVLPEYYVDVKALMGDSSDCIPGVSGIGEKTAFKLIEEYTSLDNLYEKLDIAPFSSSVRKKLTDGRDMAYLSRTLSEINRFVPDISSLPIIDCAQDDESLSLLFSELEFTSLKKRFNVDTDTREKTVMSDIAVREADSEELLLCPSPSVVAFDGERMFLFSEDAVLFTEYTKEFGERFFRDREIICHDCKTVFKMAGVDAAIVNVVFDTMLAAYLLNPGEGKYPLDKTASYYGVFKTGAADAELVRELYLVLNNKLEESGMSTLLGEIEIPLARVLYKMEKSGFKLDCEGLRKYADHLYETEKALEKQIYFKAGREFNINSPKQLGEILYDVLKLPAGKKLKTGYSTDAKTLEKLRPYSDIIGDILDFRKVGKLYSTYGEPLIALADENSKVHTIFNQTGTITGRLSSLEPNLQNIPVRGELGREIRKYFVPDGEGRVLIDADYSQIELRILAAISQDENMIKAFDAGEDIHTDTAAQVFGVPREAVTAELRSRAKAVNFGIAYGIGDFSLAQDLGISRKEAKKYIDNYLSVYRGISAYLTGAIEAAKALGYTETLFGRKRYIPELKSDNKRLAAFGARVAMNSPIQGSAADIIKVAMIRADKALEDAGLDAKLILQVHDELIIEASEKDAEAAADILRREMEGAFNGPVKFVAETNVGENWYDAK